MGAKKKKTGNKNAPKGAFANTFLVEDARSKCYLGFCVLKVTLFKRSKIK